MAAPQDTRLRAVRQGGQRILAAMFAPPALAFVPALTLASFWLGGEGTMLVVALGLPLVLGALRLSGKWPGEFTIPRDALTGLIQRPGFEEVAQRVFQTTDGDQLRSVCYVIELSELDSVARRHGQAAADTLVVETAERIGGLVRRSGQLARIGDGRFAICLDPCTPMDLELAVQLAGRLHALVEMPLSFSGAAHHPSCAIGFCLRQQIEGPDANLWIAAAQEALADVRSTATSGIRAYSAELQKRVQVRADLRAQAVMALENGQVQPWFQPQVSTDTGKVTGFEALARWAHPDHGMIAPDTFLPVMQEAGLLERLGEVILRRSLEAVKGWDSAGLTVPRVGVNFAGDELNNPRLVERIEWELDRLDLSADRLAIEILETVASDDPGDRVTRNISGLAALGCRIDLDDFGTGHASLASVRRLSVSRLKIDRGFVAKADRDRQQQRLIVAILTMAERLDLETLAEGVETSGEHALLAQLGCGHVQGYGIGRPMPYDATLTWIREHEAKLQNPPSVGREAG